MAKSLRSKVKRDFRSKKREAGVYAAAEAARLHRLNARLSAVVSKDKDGDDILRDDSAGAGDEPVSGPSDISNVVEDSMQLDDVPKTESFSSTRISTHGPRGSRREEWRLSKGLSAQPSRKGMNRQGGIAARRKAGRSKRRR
ncbi:hypothetical protein F5878DRAFT_623853 [Lentinula raphanica]|uniref:DUF2423 domain-containing protein n=1 Tax=Lentinula raphanica TaxID=153919 RepID=A0AA38P6G6_9AGAR|nr:hypothetical protein C8R42DRAFT_665600 [Lentinula raphanica]KAJ3762886.1 hypothetical protein EV360DRAFT_66675 [Lentinula raphanica]KAJ3824291.1 hypothetical protein F5880DRAFT_1560796 [Lentinula raphanica]KAJ3836961.1 hypothetical protein F5878DRAFT_623853 [Lentinula raphanica]